MSPVRLGTKNHFAAEGQQQFINLAVNQPASERLRLFFPLVVTTTEISHLRIREICVTDHVLEGCTTYRRAFEKYFTLYM
jgi:hypothetical protein